MIKQKSFDQFEQNFVMLNFFLLKISIQTIFSTIIMKPIPKMLIFSDISSRNNKIRMQKSLENYMNYLDLNFFLVDLFGWTFIRIFVSACRVFRSVVSPRCSVSCSACTPGASGAVHINKTGISNDTGIVTIFHQGKWIADLVFSIFTSQLYYRCS